MSRPACKDNLKTVITDKKNAGGKLFYVMRQRKRSSEPCHGRRATRFHTEGRRKTVNNLNRELCVISVCGFWLHVVVPLSNTLNPEQTRGFYRARSVLTVVWSPFGFVILVGGLRKKQISLRLNEIFFFNFPFRINEANEN